jgi:hypothetical protein
MIIDGFSESSIVYTFNKETKEYIGVGDAIFDEVISKDQGKKLYRAPEFSSFNKPPITKKNEVSVWMIIDQWEIHKDFRGDTYYEKNGKKITITKIDEVIPDWGITIPPPPEFIKPRWDGDKWIETNPLPPLKYKGNEVTSVSGVDRVTSNAIKYLDEDAAKTKKMLAGDNPCPEWEEFLVKRQELLDEGRKFKQEHFPKSNEK